LALVLFSGGLDSLLAAMLVLEQNIDVEAVNFMTPFYIGELESIKWFSRTFKIKVHRVFLGDEYLRIVVDPPSAWLWKPDESMHRLQNTHVQKGQRDR